MMTKKTYKPGETVPESGQYGVLGPRGGDKKREITGVKGKTFPPTQTPGEEYILNDKTEHQDKK